MQTMRLKCKKAFWNKGIHHMLLVQYLFIIIRAHTYTCTFIFVKTFTDVMCYPVPYPNPNHPN